MVMTKRADRRAGGAFRGGPGSCARGVCESCVRKSSRARARPRDLVACNGMQPADRSPRGQATPPVALV
eukprot:14789159-Alexandrium_andersonii.AAC.1